METVHKTIPECLSHDRLVELFDRTRSLRVAVIGDMGLDVYWYVDMNKASLSRETPHFVRPVVREEYSLGSGANIAHNLAAWDVKNLSVFSVLGDDWRGTLLNRQLSQLDIDTTGYLSDPPGVMGVETTLELEPLSASNLLAIDRTL